MKPIITIEYCPKCGWLLRAAYIAQELLVTFNDELKGVTLQPSEVNGNFHITINDKQMVRDVVAPGKTLGHADTKPHHHDTN